MKIPIIGKRDGKGLEDITKWTKIRDRKEKIGNEKLYGVKYRKLKCK